MISSMQVKSERESESEERYRRETQVQASSHKGLEMGWKCQRTIKY
jgi:hypothetical protein